MFPHSSYVAEGSHYPFPPPRGNSVAQPTDVPGSRADGAPSIGRGFTFVDTASANEDARWNAGNHVPIGNLPHNTGTPDRQRLSSKGRTPQTVCRAGGTRHLSLPNSSHRSVAPERFSTAFHVHDEASGPGMMRAELGATLDGSTRSNGSIRTRQTALMHSVLSEALGEGEWTQRFSDSAARNATDQRRSNSTAFLSPHITGLPGYPGELDATGRATTLWMHPSAYQHDDPEVACPYPPCDGSAGSEFARKGSPHATEPPYPFAATQAPVAATAGTSHDDGNRMEHDEDEVLIARPTVSPPRRRTGRLSTVVVPSDGYANQTTGHPHLVLNIGVDDGNSAPFPSSSASMPATQQPALAPFGTDQEGGSNEEGVWTLPNHSTTTPPPPPLANLDHDADYRGFRTHESHATHHDDDHHGCHNEDASSFSSSQSSSLLSPLAELQQAPRKSYTRDHDTDASGHGHEGEGGGLFRPPLRAPSRASGAFVDATQCMYNVRSVPGPLPDSLVQGQPNGPRGHPAAASSEPRALHEMDSFNALPGFHSVETVEAEGGAYSPRYSLVGATASTSSVSSSFFLSRTMCPTVPPSGHPQAPTMATGMVTTTLPRGVEVSIPSDPSQSLIPVPGPLPLREGLSVSASDPGGEGGMAARPPGVASRADGAEEVVMVYSANGGAIALSHISTCGDATQDSVAPPRDLETQFAYLNLQGGSPTQKRLAFDDAAEESSFRSSGGAEKNGRADASQADARRGLDDGADEERQEREVAGHALGRRSIEPRPSDGNEEGRPPCRTHDTAWDVDGFEDKAPSTPGPRTRPTSPLAVPREPTTSPYVRRADTQGTGGSSTQAQDRPVRRPAPASVVAARRAATTLRPSGLQLLQGRKRCLEEISRAADGNADPAQAEAVHRTDASTNMWAVHGNADDERQGKVQAVPADGPLWHGATSPPAPMPAMLSFSATTPSSSAPRRNSGTRCSSSNTSVDLDYLASMKRCRREFQRHKDLQRQLGQPKHQVGQSSPRPHEDAVLQEIAPNVLPQVQCVLTPSLQSAMREDASATPREEFTQGADGHNGVEPCPTLQLF